MNVEWKKGDDDKMIMTEIKGSEFSAGFDLHANEDATIEPNDKAMISTGIHCTLSSPDYYLRVAPRSGLAAKHAINVLAGVVDYDYTGEIKVILINHGKETFTVNKYDRVGYVTVSTGIGVGIVINRKNFLKIEMIKVMISIPFLGNLPS